MTIHNGPHVMETNTMIMQKMFNKLLMLDIIATITKVTDSQFDDYLDDDSITTPPYYHIWL